MKRLGVFLSLIILGLLSITPHSLASNLDWKVYETDHFIIFFHAGYEFQAQETAYFLEQSLPRAMEITGNERNLKTRIVIQDVGLNSNGFADFVGNKISIFTTSPIEGTLLAYQDWFRLVSGHELTHIRHILNYSGAGTIMPTIFGNYLASNMHAPGWIMEGVTVYNESQITPYEGRLNDGYFDAVLAAKAAAGKFPTILEANYTHNYFPPGQYYLFGGTFMRYLAENYGEEKITAFFDEKGKHLFGFLSGLSPDISLDPAARKVFGKSFDQLFKDWEKSEVAEHQNWRIDGELVLENAAHGFITNLLAHNGKLYYTKLDLISAQPSTLSGALYLMEYDPKTEKEKVLKELTADVLAKVQIHNNKLYYLTGEFASGLANIDQLGFGATGLLMSYDLANGRTERIFTDDLRAFEILENGEIIYAKDRKDAYGSDIWKYTGSEKVKLGTIPQAVAEIETYQDHLIIAAKPFLGGWNIYQLNSTDLAVTPIVDTPWAELSMSIAGDTLYYSANYEHEWSVYAYNLSTEEVTKLTEGGYSFNGVELNNELYFKGLTAEGDALFKKPISPVPHELGEREVVSGESVAEFAENLQAKNSFGKNLSYLLMPTVRVIPVFFSGTDGLGINSYSLSLSQFGGFDLALTSSLAQPLQISLVNQKFSPTERETILSLGYPLYNSMQGGLSGLSIAVATNFTSVVGTLEANFRAPRQNFNVGVSGTSQGGINTEVGYQALFNKGNLTLQAKAFNHYSQTVAFRGTDIITVSDATGVNASADYTWKLAEVRKGFWPSTLFLADIYGGVFTDYTTLDGGRLSGGANVKLELGMGYHLLTTPEIGLALSSSGSVKPYFGFGFGF